jgi:glycosyltransferase involved in cell wall biosynthesis
MTARSDPMKDHSTFFRAAALLAGSGIAADFILIGRGSDRSMPAAQPYLADRLLGPRLHFLGERDDVQHLTAGFDLATLSSAFGEGFPNVIAEAMACSVPVVSTDVGDARRILGEAGILVPPRDPPALAAAWRELLAAPSRRVAMGRAGRQRITETFGLDRMIDRYGQLYEQVRAGRRSF